MANFEKCIFEILAKLGAAELQALCNFLNTKIDLLQRELDKALAFTNFFEDQFNEIEAKVRAGEALFDSLTAGSPLLAIATSLGPDCGSVPGIFTGLLEAAGIVRSGINDALYAARQIVTLNGLIQAARNEAADVIQQLRDLCNIIQLVIVENAATFGDFLSGKIKPATDVIGGGVTTAENFIKSKV